MSRKISRASFKYLVAMVAPHAAKARAERLEKEKELVLTKKLDRLAEQFEREHAPDPLVVAMEDERRAKAQAHEERQNRSKLDTTSDIFRTSAQIAGLRPRPPRE